MFADYLSQALIGKTLQLLRYFIGLGLESSAVFATVSTSICSWPGEKHLDFTNKQRVVRMSEIGRTCLSAICTVA